MILNKSDTGYFLILILPASVNASEKFEQLSKTIDLCADSTLWRLRFIGSQLAADWTPALITINKN